MLTLQILDGGQTFFHPLEDRPLTLGAAEHADVRLTEAGVAAEHARIEPIVGEPASFKIVDLGSESGTRVSGELVVQRRIALGDRIEIGRAIVVVGRRVLRAATASDVLDDARVAGVTRRRVREREGRASGHRMRVAIGVALAIAATLIGLWSWSQSRDPLPIGWADVAVLRRSGKFDEALRRIEGFRAAWAGNDAGRRARLDALAADVRSVEELLESERQRIRHEAATRSRLEQFEELRGVRDRDPDGRAGEIAALLLSELTELRLGVEPRAVDPGATPAEVARAPARIGEPRRDPRTTADTPPPVQPDTPTPLDAQPGAQPESAMESATESVAFVREQLRSIAELRGRGELALALETLKQSLPNVAAQHAAPLRETLTALEEEAGRAMRALLDEVRERALTGRIEDVDAALDRLRAEERRFPTTGTFAALVEERRRLERYRARLAERPALFDAVATDASERLGELRFRIAGAQQAHLDGHFGTAAQLYGDLADRVAAEDPMFARSLTGKRIDLGMCEEVVGFAVERADQITFTDAEGAAIPLRIDPAGRPVTSDGARFPWERVGTAHLANELRRLEAPPRVLVGGAVFAYRAGEIAVAEDLLGRAIRADQSLQVVCNGVIARGRGEPPDPDGYRLVDGKFVAGRAIRARDRAKELGHELAKVVRRSRAQRDAWLEKALSRGPQELDAFVVAVSSQVEAAVARLEKDMFRRHYDKVAELRTAVDRARAHAKALIFDEREYFYPYRPPAVSTTRAEAYWRVQTDVDDRVAALRDLWQGRGPSKRAPARLFDELERIDWMVGVLASFGEAVPGLHDRLAWLRSLPRDRPLELQSFCWDEEERRRQDRNERILAYNRKVFENLSKAEVAQVEITNAYRSMFGHRPLAVNPKIEQAARGHAEEMARLGYFGHFSPVPARRTPHDRMALAEYSNGISENIARHGSAETAHRGWTQSSGHHRNLLHQSHTEFGVGNDGNLWVQNFGRGEEYLESDRFPAEAR